MPRAIPATIPVEVVRNYTDAEFLDRLREAIRGVDRWSATEQAVINRLAEGAAEPERRVVAGAWSISRAA
jgi:hypothetical protein